MCGKLRGKLAFVILLSMFAFSTAFGQTALSFNPSAGSYVSLPTAMMNGPVEFTFELWSYPTLTNPNYFNQDIISNPCGGEFNVVFTPAYHVGFNVKFSNNEWYGTPSHSSISSTQYHHIAAVFDHGTLRIFVDGSLHNETYISEAGVWVALAQIATTIGCSYNGGYNYNGKFDEIRLSNVARYSTSFTPSTRFAIDNNTVGLWHCDEGEGTVLHDATSNQNDGAMYNVTWTTEAVTGVPQLASVTIPTEFSMGCYPNPFNSSTIVKYSIPNRTQANIVVFDAAGRIVSTLNNGVLDAGSYQTEWNGTKYASGTYFIRAKLGLTEYSTKLQLVK